MSYKHDIVLSLKKLGTLTHPQLVRPMFEYSSIVSLAKDKVYCPRYCGLSMYQVFIFLLCSTNFMSELASKFRFLNLNKTQFVDQKLKTLLGGLHLQLAFGIKIW